VTRDEFQELLDEYLPTTAEPTAYLATCDTAGPHVRPVTLVRDGVHFYFATSRRSEKTNHIDLTQDVEFVCLLEKGEKLGCLRVAGRVAEISGPPLRELWTRAQGYNASLHFPKGLEDPDLIAFRIHPTRIRLRPPGEREIEVRSELLASSE